MNVCVCCECLYHEKENSELDIGVHKWTTLEEGLTCALSPSLRLAAALGPRQPEIVYMHAYHSFGGGREAPS